MGFFIIKFESEEDCNRILGGGPYFNNKQLMMMKRWSIGDELHKDLLSSVPVWVKLPRLPLECWTEEGISRIASVIGIPIKMDKVTEGLRKIDYARVSVEISGSSSFPSQIPILYEGTRIVMQDVVYEWRPSACSSCQNFGHSYSVCPFPKVWVAKQTDAHSHNSQSMNVELGSQTANV